MAALLAWQDRSTAAPEGRHTRQSLAKGSACRSRPVPSIFLPLAPPLPQGRSQLGCAERYVGSPGGCTVAQASRAALLPLLPSNAADASWRLLP